MFIGHHAAGFVAKRFAPRVSLGTLFAAAMLLDLIWPLLVIADVEHLRVDPGNTAFTPIDFYDYPWTHSLLVVLGWSALFAIVYRIARKAEWRDAIVVGTAVLSHWVLDFITHRPDLPLWPNGPKVGLGLWNSIPGTVIVEVVFFAIALWLYLRATQAIDRTGTIALWALVVFVGLIYATNLTSPPPDAKTIGYVGLAAWLFVPWGYWIDRHRRPRP